MSYSFAEVLPFMVEKDKHGRHLMFNIPVFEDAFNDKEKAEALYKAFDGITSEYDNETFVFEIPAFTGTHYQTKQVRSFPAKTFNIILDDFEKDMDGYEGKVNYHYYADLIDEVRGEKMDLYYYFDANMSLCEVDIRVKEKNKKRKKK